MRLPRDISGAELVRRLSVLGYEVTRTTGSHQRLTTQIEGKHHITIPLHSPLRIGTLASIVDSVAEHAGIGREKLREMLFW